MTFGYESTVGEEYAVSIPRPVRDAVALESVDVGETDAVAVTEGDDRIEPPASPTDQQRSADRPSQ